MGLFSSDLIESDPVITLTEKFGLDLRHMVQDNRELLLASKRTHGITSVMTCIEHYINTLDRREKYIGMNISGRNSFDPWNLDTRYVTLIKDCLWIIIHTKPFIPLELPYYQHSAADEDKVGRGCISLILNEDLTEWKYSVKLY
jgi:hypothetical protein